MILNTPSQADEQRSSKRSSAKTRSVMVWAIVGAIVDLPVLAGPESVEPEDQSLFEIGSGYRSDFHSNFSPMSATITIQDNHMGFDICLFVRHLDRLPEQEGCGGDLCPCLVIIDDGISDIMNSEHGQTGDVNHHRACFAH